jgi:hypothetical protein
MVAPIMTRSFAATLDCPVDESERMPGGRVGLTRHRSTLSLTVWRCRLCPLKDQF